MKQYDDDEIIHEMYIHLMWSTINQEPLMTPSMAPQIYDLLCNTTLAEDCHLIGGSVLSDHIQLVIKLNPNTVLSNLISNLKVASSLWIRTNFSELEKFEWQESDFAFSVSFEDVGDLVEKIKKAKSFNEEIYPILNQNEMDYDPVEILQ